MKILIKGGHIYDPANKREGLFDILIDGNKIVKVAKKVRAGEKVEIIKEINRFCDMCRGPCLCQIHRKVEKVPAKCGGCFQ